MRYPQTVLSKSVQGPTQWDLVSGMMAHFGVKGRNAPNEVMRLDASTVICREPTEMEGDETERAPVYRHGPSGPIGVPSGLVFLRFSTGDSLGDHLEEIKACGFEIERDSSKDAAAGWVKHISGSRGESLRQVERLMKIAQVVVVEPQMLMVRQSKVARPPGRRSR